MTQIGPAERVDTARILALEDAPAAEWLKDNCPDDPDRLLAKDSERQHLLASFVFCRRGGTVIRLAAAQYGSHLPSLKKLLKHGSRIERLAVLSNALIGPVGSAGSLPGDDAVLSDGEARDILEAVQSRPREFAVFASNPKLDRDWLADLIEEWGDGKGMDSDVLLELVRHLSRNPIISQARDDTIMDGWAEYSYTHLNLELAKLLHTVPVTLEWAAVLGYLLPRLLLPYTPDGAPKLVERWNDPAPTERGERFWFPALREEITKYLLVRDHRSQTKEKITVNHDDQAVRLGLYSTLSPYELFEGTVGLRDFEYPSFEEKYRSELTDTQKEFMEQCSRYFERDKNEFVEALIRNEEFWKKREERKFLNDISWHLAEDPHSMMDVPNLYRMKERYYVEACPLYFQDDDLVKTPKDNTLEGRLEVLRSDVEQISKRLEDLSLHGLADEQRDQFEEMRRVAQIEHEKLARELEERNSELERIISSSIVDSGFANIRRQIKKQGMILSVLMGVLFLIGYLLSANGW